MLAEVGIPNGLLEALKPVTLVVGHYGVGKTNFSVNLAIDLVGQGYEVTLIDLDIVNPYFRASEQRKLLEEHGIDLVAPVFAESGSSLDVPSLTGRIAPAIETAGGNRRVIIDVGGDDAGSVAVGRYARFIEAGDYAMICVLNRYRNLVQAPEDAVENLREIEVASRLKATALVSDAHLKAETTREVVENGVVYAREVADACDLPLVAACVPPCLTKISYDVDLYSLKMYVRSPWE